MARKGHWLDAQPETEAEWASWRRSYVGFFGAIALRLRLGSEGASRNARKAALARWARVPEAERKAFMEMVRSRRRPRA